MCTIQWGAFNTEASYCTKAVCTNEVLLSVHENKSAKDGSTCCCSIWILWQNDSIQINSSGWAAYLLNFFTFDLSCTVLVCSCILMYMEQKYTKISKPMNNSQPANNMYMYNTTQTQVNKQVWVTRVTRNITHEYQTWVCASKWCIAHTQVEICEH